MTKLTTLEQKVYDAMKANAMDCSGGDFGIMEEMDYRSLGLSAQAFGGVVTALQNKNMVEVHDSILVNGVEKVTQFTVPELR